MSASFAKTLSRRDKVSAIFFFTKFLNLNLTLLLSYTLCSARWTSPDYYDKMRLVVCKEEFESMMNHPELRNKNIPVLILANKIDIRGAFTANDIRSQLELDRLRNKKWHVFGSNALNGEGVGEAFDWLAQELKSIANLS